MSWWSTTGMSLEKVSGKMLVGLQSGLSWARVAQPIQGQIAVFWVDGDYPNHSRHQTWSCAAWERVRALPCTLMPVPSRARLAALGLQSVVGKPRRHPCPREPCAIAGEGGRRMPCLYLKAISIYVHVALPLLSALFYETNTGKKKKIPLKCRTSAGVAGLALLRFR